LILIEIGWIRDGVAAPRVDAGCFIHFELDSSIQTLDVIARRARAMLL